MYRIVSEGIVIQRTFSCDHMQVIRLRELVTMKGCRVA